MRIKVGDPHSEFAVLTLDGEVVGCVREADTEEGWVDQFLYQDVPPFPVPTTEPGVVRKHGKVEFHGYLDHSLHNGKELGEFHVYLDGVLLENVERADSGLGYVDLIEFYTNDEGIKTYRTKHLHGNVVVTWLGEPVVAIHPAL